MREFEGVVGVLLSHEEWAWQSRAVGVVSHTGGPSRDRGVAAHHPPISLSEHSLSLGIWVLPNLWNYW